MIAKAGDVVILEEPWGMTAQASEDLRSAMRVTHDLTGVRFVFVPRGTKSPEPAGMKELVAELGKLRSLIATFGRGRG